MLDFDYRGSSGYGRDYRTDIYKAMGHRDVDGAIAAISWLAENEGVDPERVGLDGISYGGFFTLMAQFRHPGRFGRRRRHRLGDRLGPLQPSLDQPRSRIAHPTTRRRSSARAPSSMPRGSKIRC